MRVFDPLPSLGYGVVKRVSKKTVHVVFIGHDGCVTVYDEEHLQFLEEVNENAPETYTH
ncbi:MAG: hypothetical protein ACXW1D_00350 [Halobacteriota archaeon]